MSEKDVIEFAAQQSAEAAAQALLDTFWIVTHVLVGDEAQLAAATNESVTDAENAAGPRNV